MFGFVPFLRCVGKAAVKHGLRALAGLVPMGGELYDMACDAWADYRGENKHAELRAELQALAQASPAEARQAAEQVTREVAAGQPPEVHVALNSYLSQVPAAVRQSLRRPADPTGTTVPGTLALNKPEDLLPFLPARLPRFKPGDCPPGIGDWELVELLGVGGFGEVWKARHATLTSRKAVALKFCLDNAAASALRNEAQLLDRVMQHGNHPGIVPLLQTYLRADPPCLEYELVEGGDLSGLMQELAVQGGVSPPFAGQIISRLAKTIAFAHRLNPPIVHRDLKPANILVQRKPDGKVGLRIADFGIGGLAAASVIRQERSRPASRQQTLPSAIRGAYTPLYASPQQRRGLPPDVRDDVHALGVIWHQLLVGDTTAERPGGRGWRKKLEKRGMSTALLDVLESCIEDDPNERPTNAEDMAARIEMLLKPIVVVPLPAVTPRASLAAPRLEPTKTEELPKEFVNSIGMKLMLIPAGAFQMGSPDSEAEDGEDGDSVDDISPVYGLIAARPSHEVEITQPFFLGAFPVTQAEYERVMGDNPSYFARNKGRDNTPFFPVEFVAWKDAVEFCRRLSELPDEKRANRRYRLPTEAEWEWACRAGSKTAYYFGDDPAQLGDYAWYSQNSNDSPHKVGMKKPNAWGLYDMHGNVWEFCQDWYDPSYYRVSPRQDPQGPKAGPREYHVARGGDFYFRGSYCQSAFRMYFADGGKAFSHGFRAVCCVGAMP